MKTCNKCQKEKTLEDFYKGWGVCKECRKEYDKNYNRTHKKEIKEYSKKYIKKYRQKNIEKIKEYEKIYNKTHKKENRENQKKHYQENREKYLEYRKKYHQENRENQKKYQKKHNHIKYYTDPVYKLKRLVRNRIYQKLKSNKSYHSIEYLGCTIHFYKQHLEKQFDKNMNWENYGSYWEIDHIKQLYTFNLIKEEEQFKAFNYTNTRPLEKIENRSRPKT